MIEYNRSAEAKHGHPLAAFVVPTDLSGQNCSEEYSSRPSSVPKTRSYDGISTEEVTNVVVQIVGSPIYFRSRLSSWKSKQGRRKHNLSNPEAPTEEAKHF
eukprot:scaffold8633_cov130-Skeletonema_dohrnii-CCMP3373.AAC.3